VKFAEPRYNDAPSMAIILRCTRGQRRSSGPSFAPTFGRSARDGSPADSTRTSTPRRRSSPSSSNKLSKRPAARARVPTRAVTWTSFRFAVAIHTLVRALRTAATTTST
jgi:hypothetical protein